MWTFAAGNGFERVLGVDLTVRRGEERREIREEDAGDGEA